MAKFGIQLYTSYPYSMTQSIPLSNLCTLLMLLLSATHSSGFSSAEISRNVRWVDDLIKDKNAQEFYSQSRKNYSKVMYFSEYDSIFALSENALLTQIQSETLEYIDQYVVPGLKGRLCREMDRECQDMRDLYLLGKVRLSSRQEAPLLCYSYGLIYLGNRLRNNPPIPTRCFVPQANLHNRIFLDDLKLDDHVDAEFLKESVIISSRNGFLFIGGKKGNHARLTRISLAFSSPSSHSSVILRTKDESQALSDWTRFLTAFETDDTVYFVIREKEKSSSCHPIQGGSQCYITRILRVCKNDMGGMPQMMDENNFGTLAKANLLCQVQTTESQSRTEKASFFMYHLAVDATWNDGLKILTVLFHSNRAGPKGSAVCAFKLQSIEEAFSSPKYDSDTVDPVSNVCSRLMKVSHGLTEKQLLAIRMFSTRYPLRKHLIQPYLSKPVLIQEGNLWQRVTLQTISIPHNLAVLYIVPEERHSVLSVSLSFQETYDTLMLSGGVCLYHATFFKSTFERITDIILMNNGKQIPSMLLSTNRRLVRIPLSQCSLRNHLSVASVNHNQDMCFMDPFCGWHATEQRCYIQTPTGPDRDLVLAKHYESLKCSQKDMNHVQLETVSDLVVAGQWFSCLLGEKEGQNCLCRLINEELEVKNCSVNGGWTPWSTWSTCSEGCNRGLRERYRACSNPRPMFNGKLCPSTDKYKEIEVCQSDTEVCASDSNWIQTNDENGWDAWSEWSSCSQHCGPGIQTSTRKCSHQKMCVGKDTKLRNCYGIQCSDVIESSSWTPWLKKLDTFGEDHLVRVKFQCNKERQDVDRGSRMIVEEKLCSKLDSNSCTAKFMANEGHWSMWSPWSVCNRNCDGGMQTRNRSCLSTWCIGITKMTAWCNMQTCETNSLWLSWSIWSPCIGSCGDIGFQHRERRCRVSGTCEVNTQSQKRVCQTDPCRQDDSSLLEKQWKPWTVWSTCSDDGFRSRNRECVLCTGSNQDIQRCEKPSNPANASYSQHVLNWWQTVLVLLVGILAGALAGLFLPRLYEKLCRRNNSNLLGPGNTGLTNTVTAHSQKIVSETQLTKVRMNEKGKNATSSPGFPFKEHTLNKLQEEETNLDSQETSQRSLPNKELYKEWKGAPSTGSYYSNTPNSPNTYSRISHDRWPYSDEETLFHTPRFSTMGGRKRLNTPPDSTHYTLPTPPRRTTHSSKLPFASTLNGTEVSSSTKNLSTFFSPGVRHL